MIVLSRAYARSYVRNVALMTEMQVYVGFVLFGGVWRETAESGHEWETLSDPTFVLIQFSRERGGRDIPGGGLTVCTARGCDVVLCQ